MGKVTSQITPQPEAEQSANTGLVTQWPALPYVLPFTVLLGLTSLAPSFSEAYERDLNGTPVEGLPFKALVYLLIVGLQVVLVGGLLCYFRSCYLRAFPLRVSWQALFFGVTGVAIWIGLCSLGVESRLLSWTGMDFSRPSFNPFTLDSTLLVTIFLTLRFVLLACLVPLAEELMLRGWLIRWAQSPNWESVSLSALSFRLTPWALVAASLYGVASHPLSEALAAAVWFGWITLLLLRTGNLWDCVVAHAITNLLLGVYVIVFSQWQLW